MSFLLDVKRIHVFKNRGGTESSTHVMHSFLNVKGPNRDRYELIRTVSAKEKRSAHVTYVELVELFAHGCFKEFNIRLRMKPHDTIYPNSPPALHPQDEDVVPGSSFAESVLRVDIRTALCPQLKNVLRQLGVQLGSVKE
jgi:hypothetical protein